MILSIEAGKLATIRCYTSMVQMWNSSREV
jgi:hypothetical protein